MGIFTLAAYPYSFKLAWSPIVDALHFRGLGRRKSWILPTQLASSALLVAGGGWMEARLAEGDVARLTALFFAFVLLAATQARCRPPLPCLPRSQGSTAPLRAQPTTPSHEPTTHKNPPQRRRPRAQDIATDGWALTLLSPANVGYAATCQTLGMNIGYFTSFTVFLALNDAGFCNAWLRAGPLPGALRALGLPAPAPGPLEAGIVSLAGYVRFWGAFFALATLLIGLFKAEGPEPAAGADDDAPAGSPAGSPAGGASRSGWRAEVAASYRQLWAVMRLRPVWRLSGLLVTYRLGVLVAEGAAGLKLLDKGVSKESIAGLVLLQFPIELASALLAGAWARRVSPRAPLLVGYAVRLAAALALVAVVSSFPQGAAIATHPRHFAALVAASLVSSFAGTLSFTALGGLFNTISDPSMGGAYLTLLNTVANMGGVLPKAPAFLLLDRLSAASCVRAGGAAAAAAAGAAAVALLPSGTCPTKAAAGDAGAAACAAAGGECVLVRDGFYGLSVGLVAVGVGLGFWYARLIPQLLALPLSAWRAPPPAKAKAGAGGGRRGDKAC